MRYTVARGGMRLLGRAVHSLAKIGDDIYIEPEADSLTLRAVNSSRYQHDLYLSLSLTFHLSRSAYATYSFEASFFSCIELGATKAGDEEERCKVTVRSLLLAFRSLSVLEKTVESCRLETNVEEDKLLLTLLCKHSIKKVFRIHLVDCDPVRAVYNTDDCNNRWTVQASVLQEAHGNFLVNQEEVTMHVGQHHFKINNYADECADEKKRVNTELSMQPGEFQSYDIDQPASLTFCLKELKSLIGFSEPLGLAITASFTEGGRPLILTTDTATGVSCVYVLATLASPDGPTASNLPRVANTPAPKKAATGCTAGASSTTQQHVTVDSTTTSFNQSVVSSAMMSAPLPKRLNSTQAVPGRAAMMDSLSLSAIPEPVNANMDNEDHCEEQVVAGTPPAKKKKRALFARCYDSTFAPSQVPGTEKVLAPDSDEES